MVACKLGSFRDKNGFNVDAKAWKSFLVMNHLDDNYFDRMKVKGITGNSSPHWWIGLGQFVDAGTRYNPSSQFKNGGMPPPRCRVRSLLEKNSKKLKQILSLFEAEVKEREDRESSGCIKMRSSNETTNGCKNGEEEDESSGSRLLQKKKNPIENAVDLKELVLDFLEKHTLASVVDRDDCDAVKNLPPTKTTDISLLLVRHIMGLHFSNQRSRLEQIARSGTSSNNNVPESEMIEIETDAFRYPLLTQLSLPLHKMFLSPLLRELVALSNNNPSLNILEYSSYRGESRTIVQVAPSTSVEGFNKRLRRGNKNLRSLPLLLSPHNESQGAKFLLKLIGGLFEDEFVSVADSLGYPLTSKVMDAPSAAAMWQEANTSKRSQRSIVRHLRAYFGTRLIVPESEIDKLGQEHVPPICDKFKMEKKDIHFWTKPLTVVLCKGIESRLMDNFELCNEMKSIDVVIGGDHGQGKFRAVTKINIRNEDAGRRKIDSFVLQIAHIDTYEVLKQSIAGPLNEGMRTLKEAGGVKVDFDLTTKKCVASAAIPGWIPNQNETSVLIPIKIFISGDLAFFTAVLGKINMSGSWCTWCKLSPKEWKEYMHEKGQLWILDSMYTIQYAIENGDINPKDAQSRKGIVTDPLFDCIEVCQYIISLLHCEIGIGNTILNSFFNWVDYRVEIISDEERLAHVSATQAKIDADEAEEDWEEWKIQHGPEMATIRNERLILNEWKIQRNDDGTFLHNKEERAEMQTQSKNCTIQLKEMGREKDEQESLFKAFKKIETNTKKAYNLLKQQRRTSHIREMLENVLVKHGIERASYHGGDLAGTHVQVLFQRAFSIFSDMETAMNNELTNNALPDRTCDTNE
eukprot:scaffold175527_cov64-Attheya_sp.AAC.1